MTGGLQLIGLVGYSVSRCRCIACGQVFQTELVIPALCAMPKSIGTICPSCLRPPSAKPIGGVSPNGR